MLIYQDASTGAEVDWINVGRDYRDYVAALTEAGVLRSGYQLASPETATTVAVRNGERTVTHSGGSDNPDQLGGFFVLECVDLAEAVEWAARCPGANHGKVVIRAVVPNAMDRPIDVGV
ncbi:YciI family protein [Actinacidiphila rubida]|uniref:YciI family protein n=1 Tax=Actinacidiphila rubida TaxID=310780 RepID=UPI0015A5ECB0|nr:YciI family protein [Actinacidiphila rubida]